MIKMIKTTKMYKQYILIRLRKADIMQVLILVNKNLIINHFYIIFLLLSFIYYHSKTTLGTKVVWHSS
jgi:hypothetical protein